MPSSRSEATATPFVVPLLPSAVVTFVIGLAPSGTVVSFVPLATLYTSNVTPPSGTAPLGISVSANTSPVASLPSTGISFIKYL